MNLKTLKIYFILISQISILLCSSGSSAPPPTDLTCANQNAWKDLTDAIAKGICATGERPMIVTNNSSQDIWLGITGGALKQTLCTPPNSPECTATASGDSCAKDSECRTL